MEKGHVCHLELPEGSCIGRVIDRQVRRLQRGLDSDRAADGDPVGYADRNLEGCGFVGCNLLNDAHPVCGLGVPMITSEQVSHGICPTDFAWPADRCDARDTAVRIFGLSVPDVRTRDTNIGSEMEFMTHVPSVAMRHGNEWL
jgi:hypothetical protein